jgi:hypothetical protein
MVHVDLLGHAKLYSAFGQNAFSSPSAGPIRCSCWKHGANLEIHAANRAYRKYLRGEKGTLEHDETKVLTSCGFPKLLDSES